VYSKREQAEAEKVWRAILAEQENPAGRTKSLKSTAYHEAGHAVVAWNLGQKIAKISIVADHSRSRLGFISVVNCIDHTTVLVGLAGVAAERRLNGKAKIPFRLGQDRALVTRIARKQFNIKDGAENFLKYAKKLVSIMVKNQWPLVEALAEELIRVRVMKGADATDFLVRTHARLLIETRFPPEPILDYLAALP
jgi:hypothetical protein